MDWKADGFETHLTRGSTPKGRALGAAIGVFVGVLSSVWLSPWMLVGFLFDGMALVAATALGGFGLVTLVYMVALGILGVAAARAPLHVRVSGEGIGIGPRWFPRSELKKVLWAADSLIVERNDGTSWQSPVLEVEDPEELVRLMWEAVADPRQLAEEARLEEALRYETSRIREVAR